MKKKKCKQCKQPFTPLYSSLQAVCGVNCSIVMSKVKEEKKRAKIALKQRKELKEQKEALKTVQQLANEAQHAFNAFIRQRDAGKPCISCDKPDNGSRNASHYYNANNHWGLRFDENNVHASCIECNKSKHGNLIEYRKRLVQKFGEDYVKDLDNRAHETAKYTREELYKIKFLYKEKLKMLKKR